MKNQIYTKKQLSYIDLIENELYCRNLQGLSTYAKSIDDYDTLLEEYIKILKDIVGEKLIWDEQKFVEYALKFGALCELDKSFIKHLIVEMYQRNYIFMIPCKNYSDGEVYFVFSLIDNINEYHRIKKRLIDSLYSKKSLNIMTGTKAIFGTLKGNISYTNHLFANIVLEGYALFENENKNAIYFPFEYTALQKNLSEG